MIKNWQNGTANLIYSDNTNPNTAIDVYENKRFRWLTFGNTIYQSSLNKRHPERAVLDYLDPMLMAARKQPGYSGLFGLGGAGIPHSLLPDITPHRLLAIEYNPQVIDVAKRFFMTEKLPTLDIIEADACEYARTHTHLFSHLIIDVADATGIPTACKTREFVENCYSLLTPDGTLVWNLPDGLSHHGLFQLIQTIFQGYTLVLPIKRYSNLIVYASRHPDKQFLRQLDEINRMVWDSAWGLVADYREHQR